MSKKLWYLTELMTRAMRGETVPVWVFVRMAQAPREEWPHFVWCDVGDDPAPPSRDGINQMEDQR